jgi:hypothetical protein
VREGVETNAKINMCDEIYYKLIRRQTPRQRARTLSA